MQAISFSVQKINIGNKQSEKIRAESILKGYEKIGYDILNVGEYETLVGFLFEEDVRKSKHSIYFS